MGGNNQSEIIGNSSRPRSETTTLSKQLNDVFLKFYDPRNSRTWPHLFLIGTQIIVGFDDRTPTHKMIQAFYCWIPEVGLIILKSVQNKDSLAQIRKSILIDFLLNTTTFAIFSQMPHYLGSEMTNQIVQNIPIHVQRLAQVHSFDFYCMVSWLTTFGAIVGRHYLNLEPTEYDSRLNRVENHQLNHTKRSLSPAFIATIEFLSLWIMNYSLRKLSSTIPSTRPCGFVSAEIFEQYLYHLPLNAWQNMNALNDNIPCAVGTNLQKNFWSNHSGNTAITAVEIILFMTLAARVLKNQSSNQVNAVQKFLHSHMSNNYIDLASTFIQIIGVSLAMGTAASRVIANCHSLSAVLNGMVQGSIQAMFAMQAIEVARPVINRLYNATLSFFSTSPNRSETQEDNTVDEMLKQS